MIPNSPLFNKRKDPKYNCPLCDRDIPYSRRYPNYVCGTCAGKATDIDGKGLTFSNIGIYGGYRAKYRETGEEYQSHVCYINGIECYADEYRLGGIVVEKKI